MKRNNEGGCACVQTGDMLEISISFPQFFCDPKTVLKKNGVQNKKQRDIIIYNMGYSHMDFGDFQTQRFCFKI